MGWLFGGNRKRERPTYSQLAGDAAEATPPTSARPTATRVSPTPQQALRALREGNEAFLRGENNLGHVKADDLDELQGGQNPIATIVGCADSRTPRPFCSIRDSAGSSASVSPATPSTAGVSRLSSMR